MLDTLKLNMNIWKDEVESPMDITLRKHAYSNILKISPPKNENFQIKNSNIFSYFCPKHKGGSNEYPQSMFLSKIRKIMYSP